MGLIIVDIKARLAELQGEMNQIMFTTSHLQERKSAVINQMAALEKELQGQSKLNFEQEARMNAASGCINGECG